MSVFEPAFLIARLRPLNHCPCGDPHDAGRHHGDFPEHRAGVFAARLFPETKVSTPFSLTKANWYDPTPTQHHGPVDRVSPTRTVCGATFQPRKAIFASWRSISRGIRTVTVWLSPGSRE